MNTYEIMSSNWVVAISVKDCIKPDKVENLVKEHFDQMLKLKGKFMLTHEKFVSFINQKLGHDSASYAPESFTNSFIIYL